MLDFITATGVSVWPNFIVDIEDWDNNKIKIAQLFQICSCKLSELYRSEIALIETGGNLLITCLIAIYPNVFKCQPNWTNLPLCVGDMVIVTKEHIQNISFTENTPFIIVHLYHDVSI